MKAISRIEGYPNKYILTSTGVILIRRMGKIQPISSQVTNSGYELVHLCKDGIRKAYTMHRLVAKTFIPNPYNKETVNHKDGNKLNNDIDNLEWNTLKENINHADFTGLVCKKGQKNGGSKLTDKKVIAIKKMILEGFTNLFISKKFKVDPSTISVIRHGKTWSHITPPFKQIEIFK